MSVSTALIGLWFFLWGAATLQWFPVAPKLLAVVALAIPVAIVVEYLFARKGFSFWRRGRASGEV